MTRQWGTLAAMCSVLAGIVLFSVIFGGYTSFYRSQNRIEASKELIASVCRDRSGIVLQLLDSTHGTSDPETRSALKGALENEDRVLQQVISQKTPLGEALTQEFETAEQMLISELAQLIASQAAVGTNHPDKLSVPVQKQLFVSQDNVFVAKKKYNREVAYFMNRKSIFPGSLIAGLFGFDHVIYHALSDDSFLSAANAFNLQGP